MSKVRALGIDLGTTFSCVACVDEYGIPQVLPNIEGEMITPSIVYFGKPSLVGAGAGNMLKADPVNTVNLIKRHMTSDESFKKPTAFPNNLDPAEISAIILKKLVADANEALGSENDPVKDVVITVPADFGSTAKARTRQAGEIAGLNVLQIINEPTAAAISYGLDKDKDQNILVYDLGGGTFDATILRICGGDFTVLATAGDPYLGGADWDARLAKLILDEYNRQYDKDFVFPANSAMIKNSSQDIQAMYHSLMQEAEKIKKNLTVSTRGVAETRWVFEKDGHSLKKTEITRGVFEEITSDLLERTVEITHSVLDMAKNPKIDTIVLVGGSTLMPQVKVRLGKEFSAPIVSHQPEFAVAKGAAFQAYKLASCGKTEYSGNSNISSKVRNISKITVRDVCSKSYGIGMILTKNGQDFPDMVENIIFANTTIPVERTIDMGGAAEDNLTEGALQVFESNETEEKIISQDFATPIGDAGIIRYGKPVPKNYPIKIRFNIDMSGILTVTTWTVEKPVVKIEFQVHITGIKSEDELIASQKSVDKIVID